MKLNKLTEVVSSFFAMSTFYRTEIFLAFFIWPIKTSEFFFAYSTFAIYYFLFFIFIFFYSWKFKLAFPRTNLTVRSDCLGRISFNNFSTDKTGYFVSTLIASSRMESVMFNFIKQFEILYSIILLVFNRTNRIFRSFMMDNFILPELSSNVLLNYITMFKNIIRNSFMMIWFKYKNIASRIDFSSFSMFSFKNTETSSRTEMIFKQIESRFIYVYDFFTIITKRFYHLTILPYGGLPCQ